MKIEFEVRGIPRGAGSKNALPLQQKVTRTCAKCGHEEQVKEFTGRVAVVDSSAKVSKDWKASIHAAAFKAMADAEFSPFDQPLILTIDFIMPRPQAHFGTRQGMSILKANAPIVHSIRPDATKLTRLVEDMLTGLVWKDDGLVCEQHISKRYGDEPGCKVIISTLQDGQGSPNDELKLEHA